MNGLTPPKSGATDWPPGPPSRAARGAPEPSEAFAGILDTHQARTATAEGQSRSQKKAPVADDGRAPASTPGAPPAPKDDAAAPAPEAEAEQQSEQQPVTDGETTAAAAVLSGVAPAPPAEAPQPESPVAAVPAQDVAPVAPPAPEGPVVAAAVAPAAPAQPPVAPDSQPLQAEQPATQAAPKAAPDAAPVEAIAAEPVVAKDAAKQQVGPVRPSEPAASAALPAVRRPPSTFSDQPHGQPGPAPQQAQEQARIVAQAYGRAAQPQAQGEAPAAQPASAPAPVATPSAPAATQTAAVRAQAPAATPVPLARAAETVEHVLRLAAGRGVTHARVLLRPAELGSVDIHLRQTADGLTAKVVAHTPEAVQQLQHAAADLRRSLEQQGLSLLGLDIGQSGDERSAGRAGAEDGGRRTADGGTGSGDGSSGDAADAPVNSTLQLPNGVLVDVLA